MRGWDERGVSIVGADDPDRETGDFVSLVRWVVFRLEAIAMKSYRPFQKKQHELRHLLEQFWLYGVGVADSQTC